MQRVQEGRGVCVEVEEVTVEAEAAKEEEEAVVVVEEEEEEEEVVAAGAKEKACVHGQ